MFSIWETRVQDFRAYSDGNPGVDKHWEKPDFWQEGNYPVVYVSWHDATAFCAWLTKREHQAGRLGGPGELRTYARAGRLAEAAAAVRVARQRFHRRLQPRQSH